MVGGPAPSSKSERSSTARLPSWRALGLGSSAIGGIATVYYAYPIAGLAIVSCQAAIALIVIAAALFGSATTSGRAFRLLRWLANSPEPDAPPIEITTVAPSAAADSADIDLESDPAQVAGTISAK